MAGLQALGIDVRPLTWMKLFENSINNGPEASKHHEEIIKRVHHIVATFNEESTSPVGIFYLAVALRNAYTAVTSVLDEYQEITIPDERMTCVLLAKLQRKLGISSSTTTTILRPDSEPSPITNLICLESRRGDSSGSMYSYNATDLGDLGALDDNRASHSRAGTRHCRTGDDSYASVSLTINIPQSTEMPDGNGAASGDVGMNVQDTDNLSIKDRQIGDIADYSTYGSNNASYLSPPSNDIFQRPSPLSPVSTVLSEDSEDDDLNEIEVFVGDTPRIDGSKSRTASLSRNEAIPEDEILKAAERSSGSKGAIGSGYYSVTTRSSHDSDLGTDITLGATTMYPISSPSSKPQATSTARRIQKRSAPRTLNEAPNHDEGDEETIVEDLSTPSRRNPRKKTKIISTKRAVRTESLQPRYSGILKPTNRQNGPLMPNTALTADLNPTNLSIYNPAAEPQTAVGLLQEKLKSKASAIIDHHTHRHLSKLLLDHLHRFNRNAIRQSIGHAYTLPFMCFNAKAMAAIIQAWKHCITMTRTDFSISIGSQYDGLTSQGRSLARASKIFAAGSGYGCRAKILEAYGVLMLYQCEAAYTIFQEEITAGKHGKALDEARSLVLNQINQDLKIVMNETNFAPLQTQPGKDLGFLRTILFKAIRSAFGVHDRIALKTQRKSAGVMQLLVTSLGTGAIALCLVPGFAKLINELSNQALEPVLGIVKESKPLMKLIECLQNGLVQPILLGASPRLSGLEEMQKVVKNYIESVNKLDDE